jgi:hypothetical protein
MIVQVRLSRFNRCSTTWRLTGGSSSRRANFLQLVSELWLDWILRLCRRSSEDSRVLHLQDVVQHAVGTVRIRLKVEHVRGSSCGGSRDCYRQEVREKIVVQQRVQDCRIRDRVAYGNSRHQVSVDDEQGHVRDVCATTGCVLLMVMEDVGSWMLDCWSWLARESDTDGVLMDMELEFDSSTRPEVCVQAGQS